MRIKGKWKYLYRAVDKAGDTVDFLLTAKRELAPHPTDDVLADGAFEQRPEHCFTRRVLVPKMAEAISASTCRVIRRSAAAPRCAFPRVARSAVVSLARVTAISTGPNEPSNRRLRVPFR